MMKICVLTTTRADYGIYFSLLKKLNSNTNIDLQLVVSGTHVMAEYGNTISEIKSDGFKIAKEIAIFDESDRSDRGVAVASSNMLKNFYDSLCSLRPDFVVLLGDRFEMLSAAQAANLAHVPIVHIHGGEITEGAFDDNFRHAITKLSHYHFTSTEEYRKRVIQLGESPDRVFNIGSLGVDFIINEKLLNLNEISDFVGMDLNKPTALMTFHPTTLDPLAPERQVHSVLDALEKLTSFQVVITLPNADPARWPIADAIEKWAARHTNRVKVFRSMGHRRYLSAMKYATVVVGNSSSGIIEAPTFKVTTVNVGSRQKGRVRADSVLDCELDSKSISTALQKSLDPEWQRGLKKMINPYGDGKSADKAIQILLGLKRSHNLVKVFYEGLA